MEPAWEFEHTVEVAAPAASAWDFWTHVENWAIDPSVEWARLDGAFEAGAVGETKQKGQPPLRWRIAEARAPERGVIEVETEGVTARFALDFEPVSVRASRLRQRITLEGPDAERLSAGLGKEFAEGVRTGMRRLADAIESAAEEEER
jgi:hypothetical protein